MYRSYNHQVMDLTNNKKQLLVKLLFEYRRIAKIILNKQINSLHKTGYLSTKSKDFYVDIPTFLSERYKDTIKRQVDGMLKSYISNRKNDYKKIVYKSSLSDETKKELYIVNKLNGWFKKENKLANKIFKHVLSKNRFPSTKRINMHLSNKVYKLEENKTTKSCTYHILLNTCSGIRGDKTVFSLKTNTRFDEIIKNEKGDKKDLKIHNSIQVNFKNNCLTNIVLGISFSKKENLSELSVNKIGLDFGIKNLLTLDNGSIYGQNFIKKLLYYDKRITCLQKELQIRGKIKLSENKRYCSLTNSLRAFIKNEVCRVVNRIIKINKPSEMVFEELDFSDSLLSKKMNRILRNCGLAILKNKLISVNEELGIKITYVNPAYTSQECSSCKYVDNNFLCQCCGLKLPADVNSARCIVGRSNDTYLMNNKYLTRVAVKRHLMCKSRKVFSECVLSSTHGRVNPSKS